MDKKQILTQLRNDEDYYGDFGKQYLSNSDIYHLLNNPLKFHQPYDISPAFLVGGYFHTVDETLKGYLVNDIYLN
jgi:hypothetical protein